MDATFQRADQFCFDVINEDEYMVRLASSKNSKTTLDRKRLKKYKILKVNGIEKLVAAEKMEIVSRILCIPTKFLIY